MKEESLRWLIEQHDKLVEDITRKTMLEKVLRHLENLHIGCGDTTTQLSVYFGHNEFYEREVVRTATSIVREVTSKMLPVLTEAARVLARERFTHYDDGKCTELMILKQRIREQLGLMVDHPAFLRKIMD